MSDIIDIHKILKILPHRYPFLLVDRVLDYETDKSLTALKNVSINEPFFGGHFPHRPVFPGVLLIEAMAQASAILASLGMDVTADETLVYLFAGVNNVRFKRPVEPGDQVQLNVELTRKKGKVWKTSTTATVDGTLCATADITFTYKILDE
ncbi:MAG: 3-hydroxyacyl-ACP dehydratase FabZ [Proteobacteria bacterium]|nr:3-hydroxyacyl-ACP dehydratase FabZ [Pseudomonadota bacterium]